MAPGVCNSLLEHLVVRRFPRCQEHMEDNIRRVETEGFLMVVRSLRCGLTTTPYDTDPSEAMTSTAVE